MVVAATLAVAVVAVAMAVAAVTAVLESITPARTPRTYGVGEGFGGEIPSPLSGDLATCMV